MKIFPAIDILGGKAVRLTKGDYATKEVFYDNPYDVSLLFEEQGASFLHIVDLDGAKTGGTVNFKTVEKIASRGKLFCEVGGGIRDVTRVQRYLDIGVNRVILGTAALEDRAFLDDCIHLFGDKIAVGVDAKDGLVATHGWETVSQTDAFQFCTSLREAGVATVIFTDIATDGAMKGTNLPTFRTLGEINGLNVIASGGITYYEEIACLRDMGTYGAILGKALYKNLLDLTTAINIANGAPLPNGDARLREV